MRILKIGSALLVLIGCFTTSCQVATKEEVRPNILLILTDDLGYGDVGFNGSKDIITPNLDKLAKNGTMFSSAYAAHPFCGPSRAGLLTGRYPHKIGAQYNLPRTGQMSPHPDIGIPVEETFFSSALQNAGYRTGVIGKWHLGRGTEHHPNKKGFDDFYGFLGGGHNFFPKQYKDAYARQKENGVDPIWDYILPLEHNGSVVETDKYLTDELSDEAMRFITESSESDDPFFMYLAYNAPHVPLEALEEDMALFSDIEDKARRTYAGMVYAVDRGVGQIVETLKATNQFENTLIIFMSDNGGNTSKGGNNFPLKEGKGSTHEGGYRSPMFFHYPGKIQKGVVYDYPVSALDFYPTFCGLAEAEIPASRPLDGIDVWDAVTNLTDANRGRPIFTLRHREGYSDVGIRDGDWKIVKTEQKKWELYDVQNDPGEIHDLSAQYPEKVKELVSAGKKWSESNVEPHWFYIEEAGKEWGSMGMPHFEETFKFDL